MTPAFAAASSIAARVPSVLIAQIQSTETFAAARFGVEIAFFGASDLVAAVPEFSTDAIASDLNAAASVLRATIGATQTAMVDVSGNIKELGELLEEIRSGSVGRLVQMAAVSPMTWALLGGVVLVSAEIARREIRHASDEPPGSGDPDLLASWGLP